MYRLFVLATAVALSVSSASPVSAQTPNEPGPIVSTAWLQQHLDDPRVHVISTGDEKIFDRGHIPGARFVEHRETLEGGHHLLTPDHSRRCSREPARPTASTSCSTVTAR